jgi:hypothetical protein
MGCKPSREAKPAFRRCEPCPADKGPARLWDLSTGAISLPRPRFARARGPAGPLLASSKSVAGCCYGSAGVCWAGRSAGAKWPMACSGPSVRSRMRVIGACRLVRAARLYHSQGIA